MNGAERAQLFIALLTLIALLPFMILATAPRSAPLPTTIVIGTAQPTASAARSEPRSEGASATVQSRPPSPTVSLSPTPKLAPTPRLVVVPRSTSSVTGWATWYDDGPGLYAAVNSYRWGDPRYEVTVRYTANVNGTIVRRQVTVVVRDFCACGKRHGEPTVIDLSPAAFKKLAPLSRGVIKVEVIYP